MPYKEYISIKSTIIGGRLTLQWTNMNLEAL